MKYLSPFLTSLAPALQTAQPEPSDAVMEIPSALLPVIQLTSPTLFPQTVGVVAGSSVDIDQGHTITNGVATTTTLCTLTPGLWSIQANMEFEFNFTNANPLALDGLLRMRQGAANDIFLASTAARTQFVNRVINQRYFSLSQNTLVQIATAANGAAQTSTVHCTFHAEKIA